MSERANSPSLPSASTSITHQKTTHNQCATRKRARPPSKHPCQPSARTSDRDAGRQTTESRQTPPPPRTPQNVAKSLKIQPPEAPGGCRHPPAPALIQGYRPIIQAFLLSSRTQRAPHAGPEGGGGLPLPAAAAAAPEKTSAQKGNEVEKDDVKKTEREKEREKDQGIEKK